MNKDRNENRSTSDLVEEEISAEGCWTCQHSLALLGFLGTSVVYSMRVNLSVAIVAMVAQPQNQTFANSSIEEEALACPLPSNSTTVDTGNEDGFTWNETEQGLVLSAFYWGYALTNIIGGLMSERYGARIVLGVSIFACGLLSVLSPLAAESSSGLFIAFRILMGITQGVTYPSLNHILSGWVLPQERSRFSGIVYAGTHFGTVVTLALSGVMCDSTFLGGWPSVFYVFGGLGMLWAVSWFIVVRDYPTKHPRISQQELKKLKPLTLIKTEKSKKFPWKSILTSAPFWGVLLMHFGYNWGFYTLLSELPTYFDKIQHFDVSKNGLISSLPYAVTWIFSLIFTNLMTYLNENRKISLVNVRRLSMSIAGFIPALGLLTMCFVGCDSTLAVVVLCISVGSCGASYAGYMCSHMDLAPRFAGTLFGITNTVSTIPGFVSPIMAGAITQDNQTLAAWRTIFLIASVLYASTAVIYVITITADIQSWNFYGSDLQPENEMKDKRQASVSSNSSEKKL